MVARLAGLVLLLLSGSVLASDSPDHLGYLVSVLDGNRPTSAEGWTRDVTSSVCPYVTGQVPNGGPLVTLLLGVTVDWREIDGQVEIHVSRLLSPLWKHSLVVAGGGTASCNATIYSDAH